MNRLVYFDNLRSAAVVLTLLAVLLRNFASFYETAAVTAIAVCFFIAAYFGAELLRTHQVSFFLGQKFNHLVWPFLFLCLLCLEETWGLGLPPVTAWVLPWLFILFLALAGVKAVKPHWLIHRTAAKPSAVFLLLFVLIQAALLAICRALFAPSYTIPFLFAIRPDWLVLAAGTFFLGVHAFRKRWFGRRGFVPPANNLYIFAIMAGVSAYCLPKQNFLFPIIASILALTAVFGLSAFFTRQLNSQPAWAHTLHRISYGLFFVGEPIINNCFYFLAPLPSLWLRLLLTAVITVIYGYLLCRYALLHITCFKSRG